MKLRNVFFYNIVVKCISAVTPPDEIVIDYKLQLFTFYLFKRFSERISEKLRINRKKFGLEFVKAGCVWRLIADKQK